MNLKKWLKSPWVWLGLAGLAYFLFFNKAAPAIPPAAPGTGNIPAPPAGGGTTLIQ